MEIDESEPTGAAQEGNGNSASTKMDIDTNGEKQHPSTTSALHSNPVSTQSAAPPTPHTNPNNASNQHPESNAA